MLRFHKKVYFPKYHKEKLISFTYKLNNLSFNPTSHCLDNIKLRALDLEQLLYWIKSEVKLDYNNIFEYYTDDKDNISKTCYRLQYNKAVDIILIVGSEKQIITIYYNSAEDKHYTLKESIYCRA